jgi:hypothetical protein
MTMRAIPATVLLAAAALAAAAVPAVPPAARAAVISIVNTDAAGEGFNDPTPAAAVGGNPGTTVGAQRLNVFQRAADIWGALLPSAVEIRVNSSFDPLSCTATSAVLGSAGATTIHANFANAEWTSTWYHQALANKQAGVDLSGNDDIRARFNSGIGQTGCLTGSSWYYGYDSNEGAGQIDLLPVVLHELGHGLGFSTFTSLATGTFPSGLPDVYSRFIRDLSTDRLWTAMTDGERIASAINGPNVVWDGTAVTFMAPLTLSPQAVVDVDAPAGIAGSYVAGTAAFGAPVTTTPVSGDVVLADDGAAPGSDACNALINGAQIAGRIALIDRGNCAFTVKARNAQDAGAVGVILADNVVAALPPGLGGADPTVTIPVVSVTQAVGNTLKANLASGVHASLVLDPTRRAGTDAAGRVLLYAPNPLQSGSSISHWDVSATPNLLMEPAINPDLGSGVDLTRYHFEDIGWLPRTTSVPPATAAGTRLAPGAPNPFSGSTALRFELARTGSAELDVLDLGGRRVRRLVRGMLAAGPHAVAWDGAADDGRRVAAGVYVVRLRAEGRQESRSIVLFR